MARRQALKSPEVHKQDVMWELVGLCDENPSSLSTFENAELMYWFINDHPDEWAAWLDKEGANCLARALSAYNERNE